MWTSAPTMQVTLGVHTVTGSKPFHPQQVHLRLTSQQSGFAAFVAGKPAKDAPGKFTFSVTSAGIDKLMLGPQVGATGYTDWNFCCTVSVRPA